MFLVRSHESEKHSFLVLITALLFGLVFFIEKNQKTAEAQVIKVLPGFKPSAINTIQVLPAGQLEIRAERTNDGWQLVKPLQYKAQGTAIEELLKAAAQLAPEPFISAQMLKGHRSVNEEFGFDTPQAILNFQQNNELRTLKLGFFTAPGDEIYAQVVGMEGIYVINSDFLRKYVPHQADDWRDPGFVNLTNVVFDRIANFTLGLLSFDLHRDSTNTLWRMTKPLTARADSDKVNALLKKLESARVTHFVKEDPKADLEAYGLQPALLDLKFFKGTNPVLSLQFGKSPTNNDQEVYARYNGQPSVVLLPKEFATPWQAGYQEFRDRHLFRVTSAETIPKEIEAFATEQFDLTQVTNEFWQVTRPKVFMADTNVMQAFLKGLAGLEVGVSNQVSVSDTVLDSQLSLYGLDKPARKYILKRRAHSPADTNVVIAELDFGSEKEGRVFVRRADLLEESSVYSVKSEAVKELPAESLQLRERRIWNFSEDQVSRLFIKKNQRTMELLHIGTNRWQIAAGSQGMINELQVEVGAQELGFLEAHTWVEWPAPDLARYGFSTNSLQISVELREPAAKNLSVDFGGWSPQHLRYGAVPLANGATAVFEFSEITLDRIFSYLGIREDSSP